MNPKNTWLWVVVAAGLFAFIFFYERKVPKSDLPPARVFPALKPQEIDRLQVLPQGQLAIHAERSNGVWRLTRPLSYPASSARIDLLLAVLEQLEPRPYIPAQDLKSASGNEEQFGFDSPQASLMIGQRNYHVLIGNRTAPGDQVYVEVVGSEGVHVVDAALLQLIPKTANDWRDTRLVDWSQVQFDQVIVTNAGKTLGLQRNPTTQLWQMIVPTKTRADSPKVQEWLGKLQDMRVVQFISDEPRPDLETYGLQTPDLCLAFYNDTNQVLLLEFGKNPTNHLTYARRSDQNTIVTVPTSSFEPWLFSRSHEFRDFFDHHLVSLSTLPDEIVIEGDDSCTLQQAAGGWQVMPRNFRADPDLMKEFIGHLTNLQVLEIVRDIVPEADLPKYGLAPPQRQYTLKSASLNSDNPTNQVLVQLQFGKQEGKIYARRAGEDFVYAINPDDFERLPSAGWKLRDRQLWRFSESDVARISIQHGSKKRELTRKGPQSWSITAGSGIIDPIIAAALDETAHRLGDMLVTEWVQHGDQNRDNFGFKEINHQITIELKSGETKTVEFGKEAPSKFPYAATVIDGDTCVFEFPWLVYQFVQMYLTIPADTP